MSVNSIAEGTVVARNHFSFRRVLLCTLPLLALLLWIMALSSLATAGGTATAEQPARMSVQVPSAAKSSGVVMLEMSIAVTRRASAAQLGAVVRLRPSGGSPVEVGRVTIAGGEQSFQSTCRAHSVRPQVVPPRSRLRWSTAAAARRRPVHCSRSHARRS